MIAADVVILAAGRGSRLGGLTADRPKCLVPLGGRALLDWQLDALAAAGLERIILVTGYRAGAFEAYHLTTAHNSRWAETNMVATLLCAMPLLRPEADLILCYSDIVYEPRLVERLTGASGDVATVIDTEWLRLWRIRSDDPLGDAETLRLGADGEILEIGGRPARLDEIQGQYVGLTKISPAGKRSALALMDDARAGRVRFARPVDDIHMTDLLQSLIDAGVKVQAVHTAGGWLEIDTAGDLAAYEALIASGGMRDLWDREAARA